MSQRIKLTAKDVPPMLRAAFPNYKGRTWYAVVTTTVQMHDTYWSGGTHNEYVGVDLETGRVFEPVPRAFGTFDRPREPTIELEPGQAVVEHSMFMGKDVGITIYVHPANARGKMLPAAGGKRRHGGGSSIGKLTTQIRSLLRS